MTTKEIITLLASRGLLSEDDSFTLMKKEEAASAPLALCHPLIIAGLSEAERGELAARLLAIYEGASPVLLVRFNGNILRLTIEEFNSYEIAGEMLFFFDSRKAKKKGVTPFSLTPIEKTVKTLLAPGGCPWDRAQDHRTLRTYFLQEVYEVIDAIDKNDMVNLKEELGDVLLQIVFHASLAEKEGYFSMQDVVDGINEKMIRRHPFVFENITLEETQRALGDWETRKRIEKNRKYLLSGVSKDLPSLLLACIIQKKVGSNGLTEALDGEPISKDMEAEIQSILAEEDPMKREEKAGRFLFAIDRVLSEKGVEPELALHRFSTGFMERWRAFEEMLFREGKNPADMLPEEVRDGWKRFSR